MHFFDQQEKEYINATVYQCQHWKDFNFKPFNKRSFSQWVDNETGKNYYFLVSGASALMKAMNSLVKGISALLVFSWPEAGLAARDTGFYLASWGVKYSFVLTTICLDIAEFFSKTLGAYLLILANWSTQKLNPYPLPDDSIASITAHKPPI